MTIRKYPTQERSMKIRLGIFAVLLLSIVVFGCTRNRRSGISGLWKSDTTKRDMMADSARRDRLRRNGDVASHSPKQTTGDFRRRISDASLSNRTFAKKPDPSADPFLNSRNSPATAGERNPFAKASSPDPRRQSKPEPSREPIASRSENSRDSVGAEVRSVSSRTITHPTVAENPFAAIDDQETPAGSETSTAMPPAAKSLDVPQKTAFVSTLEADMKRLHAAIAKTETRKPQTKSVEAAPQTPTAEVATNHRDRRSSMPVMTSSKSTERREFQSPRAESVSQSSRHRPIFRSLATRQPEPAATNTGNPFAKLPTPRNRLAPTSRQVAINATGTPSSNKRTSAPDASMLVDSALVSPGIGNHGPTDFSTDVDFPEFPVKQTPSAPVKPIEIQIIPRNPSADISPTHPEADVVSQASATRELELTSRLFLEKSEFQWLSQTPEIAPTVKSPVDLTPVAPAPPARITITDAAAARPIVAPPRELTALVVSDAVTAPKEAPVAKPDEPTQSGSSTFVLLSLVAAISLGCYFLRRRFMSANGA